MNEQAEDALRFIQHNVSHKPRHRRTIIVGVGDAGNSAIQRLKDMSISGIQRIAVSTNMQHLSAISATQKILIGEDITGGMGSSGDPNIGQAAIEASRKRVEDVLSNVDVVLVTTDLRGGIETGAAPVVAEIARRKGAIVIGVVTTSFRIEGAQTECAAQGLAEMRRQCDTVVVIDNNKLAPHLPFDEAFEVVDKVMADTIKGIAEAISEPGLINLDFSSFKEIFKKGGVAVVGVGESNAPDRAKEAVRNALGSPLLDRSCTNAAGALIHVTGDDQMTIDEANRVRKIVTEMMHENVLVSWGAKVNPSLPGILKVTLVITGVQSPYLLASFDETVMSHLHDMDPDSEPEKALEIDLELYQLENFQ